MTLGLPRTLRHPIPVGKILKAPLDFLGQSDNPKGDMWFGVKDPNGSGEIVVQNNNTYQVGDGHATWTTGRTLVKSSESSVACNWLYKQPSDLVQTGRNLILQLQMEVSPIVAISTRIVNGVYRVEFVERVNGVEHRHDLGPLPWGHYFFPVVEAKLDNTGGHVACWFAVDGWPNVNASPRYSYKGDTWQDGRDGHHTIGEYSGHSRSGVYRGYFSRFGRDETPAGAIQRAMAA